MLSGNEYKQIDADLKHMLIDSVSSCNIVDEYTWEILQNDRANIWEIINTSHIRAYIWSELLVSPMVSVGCKEHE